MSDQTTVEAGEHTAEELLTRLRAGERLLVQTEVLGSAEQLTLRFDGETYYCDTPTTLHKHDDAEGMERCMREAGYVRET
jgi:hypothetical protein